MITLKDKKQGDSVYFRFNSVNVHSNLGDSMVFIDEYEQMHTCSYSELSITLTDFLRNLKGYRNMFEEWIIKKLTQ